jgi:ribonuclease Z
LESILITHAHGDHCFGLFGIMAMLSMSGRSAPLKIVAPEPAREMALAVLGHSKTYLTYPIEWIEPAKGLSIALREDLSCECVELSHRAPSHGYILRSSKTRASADAKFLLAMGFEEGPSLGAAIAKLKAGEDVQAPNGQLACSKDVVKFERLEESVYAGGDNSDPMLVAQAAAGVGVWIHESTYSQADWENGGAGLKWGHSSARQVGAAAAAGKPGLLVLTHFSPRYGEGGKGIGALVQEAHEAFGGKVVAAKDLVGIEVPPIAIPIESPTIKVALKL